MGSNPVRVIVPFNFITIIAGWSSLVARRAHNPKVVGSNPAPAINGLLVQLVRTPPCHGGDHEFESRTDRPVRSSCGEGLFWYVKIHFRY